jgi:hypothetical protein
MYTLLNALTQREDAGLLTRPLTIRRRQHNSRSITFAVLAALLLAACAQLPSGKADYTPTAAREMAERGDHKAASREYLDMAMQASGAQKQRYMIFAAGELYLANDLEGAERVLKQAGTNIASSNVEVWAEVSAMLRLARNDPDGALKVLNQVKGTDNRETAASILSLRAQALFKLQQPQKAVATLLKREELLNNRAATEDNHRLIWSGLQTTGPAIPPDAAAKASADPVLAGWLELGYLAYANRGSASKLQQSLAQWQQANSRHPASGVLLTNIVADLSTLTNYPSRVALLLPLSGKQQAIGEAIRDGFMAAHFALGSDTQRPAIQIFDTAQGGAAKAFQQALAYGTDFIVGPLLKEEIDSVAAIQGSTVPMLVLNYAQDGQVLRPGIYQFGLSPEDEARAAADRAVDQGMYNAIALVPNNTWGSRVLAAFRDQLTRRGGKLLTARSYAENTTDFSQIIREVLLLNESYARNDKLAANIGQELEFEPRRRQDVDLIFLAANAAAAGLVKPQLKFQYADDLPIFTTSAVYQPGVAINPDLNGILFPDIPWLLDPDQTAREDQLALKRYWGATATRFSRFYAMGYDAHRLTAVLHTQPGQATNVYRGMTGTLSIDDKGQIHRTLDWARIERGAPRPLPRLPAGLTQDATIATTQQ